MSNVVHLADYLKEKNTKSYKEKLISCIFSEVPSNLSNVFDTNNQKENQEKLLNIFMVIIWLRNSSAFIDFRNVFEDALNTVIWDQQIVDFILLVMFDEKTTFTENDILLLNTLSNRINLWKEIPSYDRLDRTSFTGIDFLSALNSIYPFEIKYFLSFRDTQNYSKEEKQIVDFILCLLDDGDWQISPNRFYEFIVWFVRWVSKFISQNKSYCLNWITSSALIEVLS